MEEDDLGRRGRELEEKLRKDNKPDIDLRETKEYLQIDWSGGECWRHWEDESPPGSGSKK